VIAAIVHAAERSSQTKRTSVRPRTGTGAFYACSAARDNEEAFAYLKRAPRATP